MTSFDTYSPFSYSVVHLEDSEDCWCCHDVEDMGDGVLLIRHYEGVC